MNIAILCQDDFLLMKAHAIAEQFHWPIIKAMTDDFDFVLLFDAAGLSLLAKQFQYAKLSIDFLSGKNAYRRHGEKKQELLLKAIGLKNNTPLKIIDATAGLGRDSLIMASFGCDVIMLERNPVLFILLNNALEKLKEAEPEIKLQLHHQSAKEYFANEPQENIPDIIYLDPMYPARKKSALVKQDMRILQTLVGDDLDADEVFKQALLFVKKRVVIKRPLHAEFMLAKKPDVQYLGKAARFDVYTRFFPS